MPGSSPDVRFTPENGPSQIYEYTPWNSAAGVSGLGIFNAVDPVLAGEVNGKLSIRELI